ncbi:MAG: hypothetical protein FJZ87_08745 [Chloroflexi bacterium]|nr:hypothetical protein [Chloroflexota bacterium]
MRTARLTAAFVSILVYLAFGGNVAAQEIPFNLYAVEPPEGWPGAQMELVIYGEGFHRVKVVGVEIEGVEVRDIRVESNEKIVVSIFIPENTPAGPRGIAVIASLGQNEPVTAFLEGGFFVHEGELPTLPPAEPPPGEVPPEEPPFEPPPAEGDNGIPILLILLVFLGGLGIGGGVLLAAVWVLRNASLKLTWQSQAQAQELPKNCHPSAYITRREGIEFKPGRWKLKRLDATLYDSHTNQRANPRPVPEDCVSRLNSTARNKVLHGDTDEVRNSTASLARELGALITAWQDISDKGKDVLLEANLEGGSAEAKFARYRCVGQPGTWQKVLEWKGKLKAVDHLPATFRAPEPSEIPGSYRVFLERELFEYVSRLVGEAARLL